MVEVHQKVFRQFLTEVAAGVFEYYKKQHEEIIKKPKEAE